MGGGLCVKFIEQICSLIDGNLFAIYLEGVATIEDLHLQPLFYLLQVFVDLSAKIRQSLWVIRLQPDFGGFYLGGGWCIQIGN